MNGRKCLLHVANVLKKLGGWGYPTKELLPKYSMQILSVLLLKEEKRKKQEGAKRPLSFRRNLSFKKSTKDNL